MAYYIFKKGVLRGLMHEAIALAGTEKQFSLRTNIPTGSIYDLKYEKRSLSETYAKSLSAFLQKDITLLATKKFPDNWRQVKGGRSLIQKKIKEGTLQETISKITKSSGRLLSKWHKDMKENHPEEYHITQYNRFKKIGGYKQTLTDGTKVRNHLEKDVGDFLLKHYSDIAYEKCILLDNKAYFPDFVIGNTIIEVTGWNHPNKKKIKALKKKIQDYEKAGFRAYFFIPEPHNKFYKELTGPIISTLPGLKKYIEDALVA